MKCFPFYIKAFLMLLGYSSFFCLYKTSHFRMTRKKMLFVLKWHFWELKTFIFRIQGYNIDLIKKKIFSFPYFIRRNMGHIYDCMKKELRISFHIDFPVNLANTNCGKFALNYLFILIDFSEIIDHSSFFIINKNFHFLDFLWA